MTYPSMMAADLGDQTQDLDHIIEVSILKIRRVQITGVREERQKLLILETLHRSIERKIKQMEEKDDESFTVNRSTIFLGILHDALSKLGLDKIIKFSISLPGNTEELPRLRIHTGRRGPRESYKGPIISI